MSWSPYHPLHRLLKAGDVQDVRGGLPITGRGASWNLLLEHHNISLEAYSALQNDMTKDALVTAFSGDKYTQARKESDNAFNKFPLIVAYCHDAKDVVLAVNFAREQGVHVCARAGGHSTAGYSVVNDGMVIDVSNINGVFIDAANKRATVGAGTTWGAFNHALDAYGLHTPGGSCASVGVTGYSLGGGYGYTSLRWGMACDNIEQLVVVTAKGEIVTANRNQNADLYWAHRGGTGGNFGVVIEITYQLHKLRMVWPISVNWDIGDAANIMHVWQQKMTKTLSDRDLGLLGFLATRQEPPPNGQGLPVVVPYFCIRGIYSGDSWKNGKKAMKPLLDIGLPNFPQGPLGTQKISYANANEHLLENVEGVIPQAVTKETKRCAYIEEALSLQQYQQIVDYFKKSPNMYNILSLEPYGGAINERAPNDTAFVHRDAFFDVFVDSFWIDDATEKEAAFDWLRDFFTSSDMQPLWSEHYYQNYPNKAYDNWKTGYFGDNYPRLREIKSKWDPTNFFHYEQSIEPAKLPSPKKRTHAEEKPVLAGHEKKAKYEQVEGDILSKVKKYFPAQ